jgi:hypothetical protein
MRDPAKDIFDAIVDEATLTKFVSEQVENLYVDFKIKANLATPDVDPELQKVMSKAISGFANSAGGVIVLGVDAPQGQMPTIKPIQPLTMFEQEVNSYISRATAFAVQGVLIKSIPSSKNNGGVTLVYVPASDQAPHCSMKDKKYYHRIGDSFLAMEHYQLADLFGRRHHPYIIPNGRLSGDINWKGKIVFTIGIKNSGRSVAKYPLFEITDPDGFNFSSYGVSGNGHFGLSRYPNPTNFKKYRGGSDIVIHPGTDLPVTKMEFHCIVDSQNGVLQLPQSGLTIKGLIAADGFSVRNWQVHLPYASVQQVINDRSCNEILIDGELI